MSVRFMLSASIDTVGLSGPLVREFNTNGVDTVGAMLRLKFRVLMNNPTYYKYWDEIADLVSRCKAANFVEERRGRENVN